MEIAFQIERKNYYRLLGPIIDEALRKGWDVECWHDYDQPRTGGKGYEFPDVESAPMFVHGKPAFKIYHGTSELENWVLHKAMDAVVSLNTPSRCFGDPLPSSKPKWISIQHALDFFVNNHVEDILTADMAALYSDWWLTMGIRYFQMQGLIQPGEQIKRCIATKTLSVGFPEVDQCRFIDRTEVRRRWGIPQDQPVVALLPFPGAAGPRSFWPRQVYLEPSLLSQVKDILFQRRFEYWRHVLHGWNDSSVVRAVRTFCDRNEAYLLVKSRLKTPIPKHTTALADKCLYDELHYPATILEALSIASLCIHFYSTAVTESAYVSVPSLCIYYPIEDLDEYDEQTLAYLKLWRNTQDNGLFQFRGVSSTMSIPEVIKTLPHKSLADFEMDPQARSAYVEKFLGYDDGQSSKRVLDAIQSLVG